MITYDKYASTSTTCDLAFRWIPEGVGVSGREYECLRHRCPQVPGRRCSGQRSRRRTQAVWNYSTGPRFERPRLRTSVAGRASTREVAQRQSPWEVRLFWVGSVLLSPFSVTPQSVQSRWDGASVLGYTLGALWFLSFSRNSYAEA